MAVSSPFNGVWRIDVSRSKVWDDKTQTYLPDEVGDEIITLSIDGDRQDYEVLYGSDPTIRLGYTSIHDDPTWVPYEVREIMVADDKVVADSVAAFRKRINADEGDRFRRFEVGKAYGLVRTVFVDERTHYRVSKDPDSGEAQSVMLRRMAGDGTSYTSTVLDAEGTVFRVRTFVRVTEGR